jgi:hypothetical protein
MVNCEIIKFDFNSDGNISEINSIYRGGEADSFNKLFPITSGTTQIAPESSIPHYTFYAIRHAEGIHNVAQLSAKFRSSYTDPDLTSKGIEQAAKSGEAFKKYLDNNPHIKISKYFVSSLKRTSETLYYFLKAMKASSNATNNSSLATTINPSLMHINDYGIKTDTVERWNVDCIVLPGSEEISKSFVKGYENTSGCLSIPHPDNCQTISHCGDLILSLNWKHMDKVNEGINEDMFKNAIDIIKEPSSGGRKTKNVKKRRQKKTRRSKK